MWWRMSPYFVHEKVTVYASPHQWASLAEVRFFDSMEGKGFSLAVWSAKALHHETGSSAIDGYMACI